MIVVQMDFDNTISVGNVSIELRNEFAPAIWREMEKEYTLGKFSVEESNVRQYALIPFGQSQIQSFVLANCYLKDGFSEFVETSQMCLHVCRTTKLGRSIHVSLLKICVCS